MKNQLFIGTLIISCLCLGYFPAKPAYVQIDPVLTAEIGAQQLAMEKIHKKRKKTQEAIIAAEALVTTSMDRVHAVENKMLKYLSEAQAVVQNLYQIKEAAELVGVEIPKNMKALVEAVPKHLEGTAITALVSHQVRKAGTDMAELIPFMTQLVTSGSYTVTDTDGSKKKHKVNLLDSAERFYIANEIVSKLKSINLNLYIIAWQIRTMSWKDLWYGLDPQGWAAIMSAKANVSVLISRWTKLHLNLSHL